MTRDRFCELWAAWGGETIERNCFSGGWLVLGDTTVWAVPEHGGVINVDSDDLPITEDNFEEIAEAYGLTPPD